MEGELLAPFDPELVVRPGDLPRAVELVNAALLGAEVDPEPLESAFALTEARHFSVIFHGYDEITSAAHSAPCRGERGPL
jgi:hypothetical protein